jgi:hypothetical protein
MAYPAILRDSNGAPIPQVYNESSEQWEAYKKATTEADVAAIKGAVDGVEGSLTTLIGKDYATQTTLAAVLAKLSADPATQTTLAAVLAAVDGLEGKDYATQGTLAAVLAKLSADPATQTTLAALLTRANLLSTEATLAALKTSVDTLKTEFLKLRDEVGIKKIIDTTSTQDARDLRGLTSERPAASVANKGYTYTSVYATPIKAEISTGVEWRAI